MLTNQICEESPGSSLEISLLFFCLILFVADLELSQRAHQRAFRLHFFDSLLAEFIVPLLLNKFRILWVCYFGNELVQTLNGLNSYGFSLFHSSFYGFFE